MGTNLYKAFAIYIMQGNFTLLPPATVSIVETVKNAQLLLNPSALTTNLPYTRRELSCRISPSRPVIRSSFIGITYALASIRFDLSGNSE